MSTITAGTTNGLQITGNDGSSNMTLQYGTGTNGLVLNSSGAIGVGSSPSYGTSGQALISNGSGSPPSWGTPGASLGKAIALDLTFGFLK